MAVVAVVAGGTKLYEYGKALFKKDIKPKIGPYVYRYVDHPFGWFSMSTGQHFGSGSSVLVYYKTMGENVTGVTDGLAYLDKNEKFAGYRLTGSKLYDANVVKFGQFVPSEGARISLKTAGAYNELPAGGIPIKEFQITDKDSTRKAPTLPDQGIDATKLIVPAIGVALLFLKK